MEKNWKIREAGDNAIIEHLSQVLGIDKVLSNLLVQRGVNSYDQAKAFFRPELSHLHDPFLMKDMDKAVERISKAIQKKETILIYGDYDVDGTTSVALMYLFLKRYTPNLKYYVPTLDLKARDE